MAGYSIITFFRVYLTDDRPRLLVERINSTETGAPQHKDAGVAVKMALLRLGTAFLSRDSDIIVRWIMGVSNSRGSHQQEQSRHSPIVDR